MGMNNLDCDTNINVINLTLYCKCYFNRSLVTRNLFSVFVSCIGYFWKDIISLQLKKPL